MSGNWPTRSHVINFSVNLALNVTPKTHQNSTQEALKIDKHKHRNMMHAGLDFVTLLGRIVWMTESSLQLIEVATVDL